MPVTWNLQSNPTRSSGDAPNFPTILDASSATNTLNTNLATRPAWQVAGVDYYVGCPSATVLKDPGVNAATFLAAVPGSSYAGGGEIDLASDATIDSWDFSLHGGFCLVMAAHKSIVATKCSFAVGTNNIACIQSLTGDDSNVTVKHCTFNGNAQITGRDPTNGGCLVLCVGQLICEDCDFHNIANDAINVAKQNEDGTSYFECRRTLFYNLCSGTEHTDCFQTGAFNGTTFQNLTRCIFEFNTYYQPRTWSFDTQGGSNSFMRNADNPPSGPYSGGVNNQMVVRNNTMIFPTNPFGSSVASGYQCGPSGSLNSVMNPYYSNNYILQQGINFACLDVFLNNANVFNPVLFNSVDLVTAGQIIHTQFNNNATSPPPPAAPVITTATPSGSTAVLVGTAIASTTISIFIDGWLVDQTTSNGAGAWGYTSGTLAAGLHSFVAKAVDANSNASVDSNTKTVTI